MSSFNQVTLIGNVGGDPDVRYLPSGDAVANLSLATSERWTDKASGDKKERTEWTRVSFFGRMAEVVAEYVKKGSKIMIQGKLQTKKWTDKENIERYTTEVRADHMVMLDTRPRGGDGDAPQQQQRAPAPAAARAKPATQGGFDDMDDDIPF